MAPHRRQFHVALTPAVDARELYRFYHAADDETLALRGVSLTVAPGEMVVIVGPSGSGKSTLMTCLAGLDDPDAGAVYIAGHRITRRPERERARLRARHIGILAQKRNLFEGLSVRTNLELVTRLHSHAQPEAAAAVLHDVGLWERRHARPRELSGGEAARAALAVALACDPAVVLADEPTAEVDALTESWMLDAFTARKQRGTAIVIATHSERIAAAADRVIALADGRITT